MQACEMCLLFSPSGLFLFCVRSTFVVMCRWRLWFLFLFFLLFFFGLFSFVFVVYPLPSRAVCGEPETWETETKSRMCAPMQLARFPRCAYSGVYVCVCVCHSSPFPTRAKCAVTFSSRSPLVQDPHWDFIFNCWHKRLC